LPLLLTVRGVKAIKLGIEGIEGLNWCEAHGVNKEGVIGGA